jgi:RNA polymerase sigma-70 factor (ECF subfamily)
MPPSRDYAQSKDARSDAELVSLIPALKAFARSFHRDQNEADDLVQETLIKGLANINRFQFGTSMKSWLFTIMRNTFYTNIRIATREAPGLPECASEWLSVEAPQEWFSRSIELSFAIDRLPKQQRDVLVLIGVLGATYDEAATICGCAKGTIKSRLNRARPRLLAELGETSERAA